MYLFSLKKIIAVVLIHLSLLIVLYNYVLKMAIILIQITV